jgi:hypothetical protein
VLIITGLHVLTLKLLFTGHSLFKKVILQSQTHLPITDNQRSAAMILIHVTKT